MHIVVPQGHKEVSVSAVVRRCGCTKSQKASRLWHGRHNLPCPNPRAVEDMGEVAYWHRNWWKRLAWRIKRIFK